MHVSTSAGHQDGHKIRLIRKNRGLSVVELAGRIGIHPQSLRNIELNRMGSSVGTLLKIADALEVDLPAIVQGGGKTSQAAVRNGAA